MVAKAINTTFFTYKVRTRAAPNSASFVNDYVVSLNKNKNLDFEHVKFARILEKSLI